MLNPFIKSLKVPSNENSKMASPLRALELRRLPQWNVELPETTFLLDVSFPDLSCGRYLHFCDAN